VTGGFLYVETIYIQASEARMPQLKKVVLAIDDRLTYRDTFSEAFAQLTGASLPAQPAPANVASSSAPPPTAPSAAAKMLPAMAEQIRHLREQAEELARELANLEKETDKK